MRIKNSDSRQSGGPRKIGVILFAISTVLSCQAASPQNLFEQAADVSGESFVRAFLGNCGQNPGQYQRVIDVARAMGYSNLPEEMRPLMAPQDPNAEFVGFFAQDGEGAPYLLGASKSFIEGSEMASCVIANPYIDTESVVSALKLFVRLGDPSHDEIGMGQRIRIWFTDEWAAGSYVSLTDAEPMGYGGATLGITAPIVD